MINKNSKIYIAGHTGLVGKSVHKLLINKGYKNILFRKSKDLDLRNQNDVDTFFKKNKPDYMVMCAARVGGIIDNRDYPLEFLLDNLSIEKNLLLAAKKYKIKRTIFLGSSCVYPKKSKTPIKESYLMSGKLEKTNDAMALAKIVGIKLSAILHEKYKRDIKAVFCGADKGYLKKTEDYVSRLNLDNQVIFLNFVDYSDLPFLYKNSIALTMPTLSGPTNIPPWEAFKLNVPVIYSDIFGIKSIYRDAVLYIDPYKVSTMVNAIINLQDNPSIKNKLIDEGKKLIKENNFDNDVKQLLSIFERNKYIKNIWKFEE